MEMMNMTGGTFAGYRIQGIDENRVPPEYDKNRTEALTLYLPLERILKDFDFGNDLFEVNENHLKQVWIDNFNRLLTGFLQKLKKRPDLIQIEETKDLSLKVQGITWEPFMSMAEPLKLFVDQINQEVEYEIYRRWDFRKVAKDINSKFFADKNKGT